MNSFVLSKVVFAAKGFPTLAALVRPLSRVDSLVLHQCRFAAEGLATFTTLVWLFSSVDSLVLDKCVFAAKGLPTITAVVMHLSDVKGLSILSVPCLLLSAGGLLLMTAQTCLFLLLLTCEGLF